MNTIKAIRALGPIDMKNINRDPMLRWMLLLPILLGFLLRWGLPWLAAQIKTVFDLQIMDYRVFILSLFVMLVPILFGMVIGFLLLDQRDDHTITALQVTPLTINGYFLYRISIPMLLGMAGSLAMLLISGLSRIPLWQLLLVALSASGLTPLFALFYASLAQNKVQGFALMKISGMIFMPALAAYFVPPVWQWAFAILPPFWPMKLTWVFEFGEPFAWFYLLAGLLVQAGFVLLLLAWFRRVLER